MPLQGSKSRQPVSCPIGVGTPCDLSGNNRSVQGIWDVHSSLAFSCLNRSWYWAKSPWSDRAARILPSVALGEG